MNTVCSLLFPVNLSCKLATYFPKIGCDCAGVRNEKISAESIMFGSSGFSTFLFVDNSFIIGLIRGMNNIIKDNIKTPNFLKNSLLRISFFLKSKK